MTAVTKGCKQVIFQSDTLSLFIAELPSVGLHRDMLGVKILYIIVLHVKVHGSDD